MAGTKRGLPTKQSISMLHQLRERNIDIVEMQMQVYNKAMKAFDDMRGYGEKGDAGVGYLSVCNQAIATIAKYSYPTMTAIKIDDINSQVAEKVIDAAIIRDGILNDPILAKAVNMTKEKAHESVPILEGKPLEVKE